MNIKKCAAAAAAAAALAVGAAVPASAGESIPKTKNGKTGISYAYYAGSDTFCMWAPFFGNTSVQFNGGGKSAYLEGVPTMKSCINLKNFGFKEDQKVRFTLTNVGDSNVTSPGTLTV